MKKLGILVVLAIVSLHAKPRLFDFRFNGRSQFGEDGIIKKIFEIIGTDSKIAVEFGAWDGFHLSNTAHLWSNDRSWKAILIEGDQEKFLELKKNTALYNCLAIHAWVGTDANNNLEAILKAHGIKETIDILSIDIDGNDYHIFQSLESIAPRLIICEFNPTIPVTIDIFAPYDEKNNFGCSVAALNRVAQKKGYKLVALTTTNAFFVLKKDFAKFAEFETDLPLLNVNSGYITLVTSYDGKYVWVRDTGSNYFYGINDEYMDALKGNFKKWDGTEIKALYQVKK